MLLKIVIVVVSSLVDIIGMVGTYAFFKLAKTLGFLQVEQLLRYAFLVLSLGVTIISSITTKGILFLGLFDNFKTVYVLGQMQSWWFFSVIQFCHGLFYSFTCMQFLLITMTMYVKWRQLHYSRKPGMSDYGILFFFILLGLAVFFFLFLSPLELEHVGEDIYAFKRPTMEFFMIPMSICFALWAFIAKVNKNTLFTETFIVGVGLVSMIVNLGILQIGEITEFGFLFEPAYLALPISSSIFNWCILASRFITYKQVRCSIIDVILCRSTNTVRVEPAIPVTFELKI